ncbi:ankyrin repeat domain-containing protein [Chitinilyticum aquatile]|uniref:ankyrin repeat domain-containing protein n=1 Tax=Chitinilyticum aquatile TaxID=362520 RepID=UPI0004286E86|nr:ankyrin repeat domain-containing protein [Chitinilyticum aquatile]
MASLEDILQLIGNADFHPQELLTRFPRIASQIAQRWGQPDLDAYFDELLIMDKPDRMGFPPEVAAELMKLSLIHQQHLGRATQTGVWDDEREIDTGDAISFTPRGGGSNLALEAVRTGNVAGLIQALDKHRQLLEVADEQGYTPLLQAACSGRLEVVGLLLERGASVVAGDRDGYQPLHWAALCGHTSAMHLLLDYGAQADARSHKGITPLMLAASRGMEKAVLLLLHAGATVGAISSEGWCALHKSAANGHIGASLRLLMAGANPLYPTPEGKLPIDLVPPDNHRLRELFLDAERRIASTLRQS